MATSSTEICNLALRQLREQPIASLTEDSEPARICNEFYDQARDYLMAKHPNNFAMTRQQLSQNATAPTFQYLYSYALPTDPYCLRAYKLWHNGAWRDDWIIEGRNLLTDFDVDCYLLYIARVTDVGSYSATFVDAFAAYLAWKLAYPLTRSNPREEAAGRIFKEKWMEHRMADGGEGFQEEPEDGVFVSIRN